MHCFTYMLFKKRFKTVADPDLEVHVRGGGGGGFGGGGQVLIYLPWGPFSFQSFLLFLPKIKGGGGSSPRSATVKVSY